MTFVIRLVGMGSAGTNVWVTLDFATNTNMSGSGDALFDPTWSEADIEAAIAEGARTALRAQGETVPADAPAVILGSISKV